MIGRNTCLEGFCEHCPTFSEKPTSVKLQKLNNRTSYKALGCNMSLKIHMQNSHLDFCPTNFGAMSNEQGIGFIKTLP